MAVTTDLVDFHTIETAPTAFEFLNYTLSGAPAVDTDYPIQGVQHMSTTMSKTGLGSIGIDFGTNPTWTAGWSFFVWGVFLPASAVNTDALGGLRILIGSATSAFKVWYVGGSDFGRYPYGGWMNFVVDPQTTADITVGTPGTDQYRYAGFGIDCIAPISKGSPLGLDAIRYGRGEIRVNGTETFTSMATTNDASLARWGLFQSESGSYLWKGLMVLGYVSAVTITDSNKNILVDNTRKVLAAFNRIEIRNVSSTVSWTGISITALGTVSKGQFEMIDAAAVTFNTCTFTDMSTFKFLSSATVADTTFRRCGQVTPTGANMNQATFEASADTTGAILITTPSDIANMSFCNFISNAIAIKITTAGTYTFIGHFFETNTVQVDFTGTGACIINPTDGSNISQAGCTASGGGSITVNSPSVTLTFTGVVNSSEIRIIRVSDGVELGGIEDTIGNYVFTHALGGTVVDIYILHVNYEWYPIRNYTLLSVNASIPVQQAFDRQYDAGTV